MNKGQRMDDVFMDRVSRCVLERSIHKVVTIQSVPVNPVVKVGHCQQFLIRRHRRTASTAYISWDCAKDDKPYILHERGRMRHLISRVVRFHALPIIDDTCNADRARQKRHTSHHDPGTLPGGRRYFLPRSGGNVPWVLGALLLAPRTWADPEEGQPFPR